MDTKPQTPVPQIQNQRTATKRVWPAICILIVVVSAVAYYLQYRALTSSRTNTASLTNAKKDLEDKNATLSQKNTALRQAVNAQQQAAKEAAYSSINTVDPENEDKESPALGKITVHKVRLGNASDSEFSTTNYPLSPLEIRVVDVTFTNNTGSEQDYSIFSFKGVTSSGEQAEPLVFPGPHGQLVWNNAKLADGDSKTVALLFRVDPEIIALQFKPEANTTPVVSALPPVE